MDCVLKTMDLAGEYRDDRGGRRVFGGVRLGAVAAAAEVGALRREHRQGHGAVSIFIFD